MKGRQRWQRWGAVVLVTVLVTVALGTGLASQGVARVEKPTNIPADISAGTVPSPWPNTTASAADLALPEATDAPASTPTEAPDTVLPLPDFEPQLPATGLDLEDPMAGSLPTDQLADRLAAAAVLDVAALPKRQQLLIAADEQYLAGNQDQATALYRQAKADLWAADLPPDTLNPIFEVDDLPPAAAVYWREANQGLALGLTHRTAVPLQLLVTEYPEFIPGQALYARYLVTQGEVETAATRLEEALVLYPSQPDLLQAQTEVQMAQEKWIEASITARQFVVLNPTHPDVEQMLVLAAENLDRFRAETNEQITQNFIGNLVTGTAGFLLTGGLLGPFTALNSAVVLMQGEDALGTRIAEAVQDQLPMVRDRPLVDYLDGIGQRLANLAGRDEFDYDFYWLDDDSLNAFALPGGKIFIHTGALMKTHSEAELAGLLAHEIAHAVLSHGFQMATNSNFLSSLASFIPIPELANVAAGLAITGYSREMERQADVLGTQILATDGYAADGLHNLMVVLQAEVGDRGSLSWFSTHPAPDERVTYLQRLVETGGYNRYAYEGVATHLLMQQRLEALHAARHHHPSSLPVPSPLDPLP
jgi:predicted Zn-dependent protease